MLIQIKFPTEYFLIQLCVVPLEAFLFTPCKAFCVCLNVYFCVSCPLIGWICLSLCLSAWLSPVSYPEEGLAGRWSLCLSHTHTQMHAHTYTQAGAWATHRNQVIEQSQYPGMPDITERQKICMKRETPYWTPPVCVCVHVSVYLLKHNTTVPWMGTSPSLS